MNKLVLTVLVVLGTCQVYAGISKYRGRSDYILHGLHHFDAADDTDGNDIQANGDSQTSEERLDYVLRDDLEERGKKSKSGSKSSKSGSKSSKSGSKSSKSGSKSSKSGSKSSGSNEEPPHDHEDYSDDINQINLELEELKNRIEYLEECSLDACSIRENWRNGKVSLDGSTVVTVDRPIVDLNALTTCFWMKSNDKNEGAPISYMETNKENSFLISNYKDFHIIVNNKEGHAHVSANDGRWHHICATWESSRGDWKMFKDGNLANSGTKLQKGKRIKGGGFMTIGQQQFNVAGKFDEHKAFIGDIAHVNMWNSVLSASSIKDMARDCDSQPAGNVFSWSPLDVYVTLPDIVEPANIC